VSCEANSDNCQIEYLYGDGSQIEGVLATESMTLTNGVGMDSRFLMGCMNNNTGIFDNYDGIIGFGRGPISLPSQFAAMGDQNVFALCLVPYTAATTATSALLFGTRDATNALGLVYTPLLPLAASDTYYWVDMVGVSVSGVDVGVPADAFQIDAAGGGGVLFDSGTPYTYFSPAVYDPVQQSVASLITYPVVPDADNFCFDTVGVTDPAVPSVTFHFAGVDAGTVVDFELQGYNAYVPQSDAADNTVFCLAIRSDSSGGSMILGSIAMANHYMEHDVVNMRLGIVSKDCTVE
jgi:hypothetical protein